VERKQRVYAALHVGPGRKVLDVGCGNGADTIPLATLVGPTGQVIGLDLDPALVAEADRRAEAAGVREWVQHRVGDASAMPFDDNTFDAIHSERVFILLADPISVFAEMVRVAKPGGWLAVIDPDGAAGSFDTPETDIERRIVPFWAKRLANGYAGRRLYSHFRQFGLADVEVETQASAVFDLESAAWLWKLDALQEEAIQAGIVTEDEVRRFRSSLKQSAAAGTFFSSFGMITVIGRKP
jgi:ubiquinone/menaquinone biosynthesis C-methylase UbiE